MDIDRIPSRASDGAVNVFVEIPKGSQNKYEYDKDLGIIALNRALYSAVHYPTDYGFVPGSRSADGEYLDAMVLVEQPTFPGCLVQVRLLGVLTITHSDGQPEHKLLTVPVSEPRFKEFHTLADVPQHLCLEIEQFFAVYKDLEGSDIGVRGWEDAARADDVLSEAIQAAEQHPVEKA